MVSDVEGLLWEREVLPLVRGERVSRRGLGRGLDNTTRARLKTIKHRGH